MDDQIKIEILIPTFNRCDILCQNLDFLIAELEKYGLKDYFRIVISDNHSEDETESRVKELMQEHSSVQVKYFRNEENIGLEPNIVSLLSKATVEYVLWTGDDDFLDEGYLEFCYQCVMDDSSLGCIISGMNKQYEDGTLVDIRKPGFTQKRLKPAFETVLQHSFLGHQLSGLLFKREGLLTSYLKSGEYRNIYPFIFFVTDRMLKYDSLYVPSFKTRVPVFNVKFWEYNKIGLLDEVFKAYYPFIQVLGAKRTGQLIQNFLTQQSSFRLEIEPKRPLKLVRQYVAILRTLKISRVDVYVNIAVILAKEYILSFSRKPQKR